MTNIVGTSWHVVGQEDKDIVVAKVLTTIESKSVRIAHEQRRCSKAQLEWGLRQPIRPSTPFRVHTGSLPPARDPQILTKRCSPRASRPP